MGELPTHNHSASTNTIELVGSIYQYKGVEQTTVSGIVSVETNRVGNGGHGSEASDCRPTYTINATHSHTVTINNTGTDTPHNNMQPFIVTYIWRRTA